jgi:hypothetical protein
MEVCFMPCEPTMNKSGKTNGYMCFSDEPQERIACYICGKPSTRLCDFRGFRIIIVDTPNPPPNKHLKFKKKVVYPNIDTCDKPMCDDCANNIKDNFDLCNEHNYKHCLEITRIADKAFEELCDKILD